MFENLGFSDICLVNIENWDLKNPRFSNIRVFDIHLYGEYRKHGCLKISDFFRSKLSIFAIGEYRKHGCLKISDFFRSKFSIFAIGEYRKHGFIKVGEIKSAISEKSAFSTWPFHLLQSGTPKDNKTAFNQVLNKVITVRTANEGQCRTPSKHPLRVIIKC